MVGMFSLICNCLDYADFSGLHGGVVVREVMLAIAVVLLGCLAVSATVGLRGFKQISRSSIWEMAGLEITLSLLLP
jgi:hypothetical protein